MLNKLKVNPNFMDHFFVLSENGKILHQVVSPISMVKKNKGKEII